MQEVKLTTTLTVYDNLNELVGSDASLMHLAIKVRNTAYAPYSNYKVGAAILLENGEIITGTNQENAAYPSGLCAERVAIFYAGSQYPGVPIKKIAITAAASNGSSNEPVSSCGACRQSIAEYEQKQKTPIEMLFMGETGKVIKMNSLADLLPLAFGADDL
ncbi:cytidine deaminase [Spongiivirga citrea]|uniref:Cytidine deaminase n=1 Tax=Spongiivirga citrea TaxID=1481457 RepID=A0A6M0CL55_9FLAO|nr:cytidine deaminase [Spongiivirga citrea]NER18666.1 cytidine deaminase [Spongiivirga citrea]